MTTKRERTERDVFHELFYSMLTNMIPEDVARYFDVSLYFYQLGRASVLEEMKKEVHS